MATAVAAALATVLTGLVFTGKIGLVPSSPTGGGTVFYLVPYHYAFAFYDRDLVERKRMEVRAGEVITLIILFDGVGALLWVGLFISTGYSIGGRVEAIYSEYRTGAMILAGALGAAFGVYVVMKLKRRWRRTSGTSASRRSATSNDCES